MQRDKICRATHFAAQSINLVNKVTLGGSADRGVAGHVGDRLQGHCKENGVHTEPSRRQSRLNSCMSRTNNSDAARKRIFTFLWLI